MAKIKSHTAQDNERTATEGETKSAKFVRLGSARMTKALGAIEQLANLAGPGYERTPAQVAKILSDLRAHVDYVEGAFKANGVAKAKNSYQL